MNMPIRKGEDVCTLTGVERVSAVVDGDGATDFAPDFDAVLAGRNSSDVDAGTANALHDVLHGRAEMSVLHEVNASIPCDGGLKHHETTRG